MALPKAIQRLEQEADAAVAALQAEINQPSEPVVTDVSQLTPANDSSEQPVSAASQQASAPAPAPVQHSDDYEQRWRTLQGKYNAEVPRLTRALQEAQQQLQQMNERLQQLSAKADDKLTEQAKPVADPKDIENFGADLVDMVNRQSERVYNSLVAQLNKQVSGFDARIKALEQQVTGVSQRTEATLEQQFWTSLTEMVPDWETINNDQRWLTWLAQVDPVYGAPRQAALDAAHKALDAKRVANVFKAFKASIPTKAADSLSNQVAPSGAATTVPMSAPAKQILSEKFVENFYRDIALGKYRGREKEVERIEAEINSAAAEGRIR